MPLNEDSIKCLELVKRGQPARFVMVHKGMKVLSVIAYRKGNLDGHKRDAREAGMGEVSFGVVDGSGPNIVFKLAVADGFEAPPMKTPVGLRDFLNDGTGFSFKPTFEIVPELPEVAMEDDGQTDDGPRQNRPLPPPPQQPPPQQPRGVVYRSQQQWDTILAQIGEATDDETKSQLFDQAVADLKVERVQVQNDPLLAGDPNAKREVEGVHRNVAEELKALAGRPLPQQNEPQSRRGDVYRSQEQWDAILSQIAQATDEETKAQRFNQAVADMKAEREQANADPLLHGDPNAKREVEGVHRYVAEELKSLKSQPLPPNLQAPLPEQQPRRQLPPQPRPRRLDPTGRVGVRRQLQLTPEQQQTRQQIQQARETITPLVDTPRLYERETLRQMLEECETDQESDFGKICVLTSVRSTPDNRGYIDSHEEIMERLTKARDLARKYIKGHADPLVGKLPSRVLKRRGYCGEMVTKIDDYLAQMERRNTDALALCENYTAQLKAGQPLSYQVGEELAKLQKNTWLSTQTLAKVNATLELLRKTSQIRGYSKLSKLQNPGELEKAEILLSHGCFKEGGGGTSDVRLLRNLDGSISHAFKSTTGEAPGALNFLQLPPGACTVREELCSKVVQDVLTQTGIDFGFPKAQTVHLDGQTGALIEGIRGVTVDPEELSKLSQQNPRDEEAIAEAQRRLLEVPEKITAQSLQKVVLFSTLTCQWDCKWGNLMVEGETNARPIDGGGAFPTQECVDDFGRGEEVRPLAILALTQYPPHTSLGNKLGQTLPQAEQPMDPDIVRGILALDVNALLDGLKTRRDQITNDFPELAPPPHNHGLVDDSTLGRVAASIQAAQSILRANPQQSLVDFATAYQNWWIEWITANRRARNN